MIQTVHNAKLAEGLNKAWEKTKAEKPEKQHLNVLIQINTSGEDGKFNFFSNLELRPQTNRRITKNKYL